MSTLVLELRQGDLMVVNGASIRFRNRTRIELPVRARFLFGKQVMAPELANTPARRIYFALQTAYVGLEEMRAFLAEHPVAYPIVIVDPMDPPRDFATPRGLPITYLIAPDGKLARQFLGPVTAHELENAIEASGGQVR